MCVRKPRPNPLGFSVMFSHSSYSGDEADDVIAVTVAAIGALSMPYNNTIRNFQMGNTEGYEVDLASDSESFVVKFNPVDSHAG